MNSSELTYLLEQPVHITAEQTKLLDEILEAYPYFQSARAVQLKGLNKYDSFKYNKALKKTASYTVDRKVLFDFITSSSFQKPANSELQLLEDIEVIGAETIQSLHKKISASFSNPLDLATDLSTIEFVRKEQPETSEETTTEIKKTEETISETENASELLEIGKPIQFKSNEPHSFNEWMQLITQEPIKRTTSENKAEKISEKDEKAELINRFIALNPKIKPVDKLDKNIDISIDENTENTSLMTETLAKVYLEQKKYDNAIQAYRILSLKYPEKSGFFADRIKAVKILQRNKS